MKRLLILVAALFLALPLLAWAVPVSVDRNVVGQFISPLSINDSIRAIFFTATSTAATSTFPNIWTNNIQATTSAGIVFRSNSNTPIADLGAGGGSNASFFGGVNVDGQTRLATSLTGLASLSNGIVSATGSPVVGFITATSGTSTFPRVDVTNTLRFNGITGTSWADFCTAITGGSGLCDGTDNTAAGGSGLATTTPWTIGDFVAVASTGEVRSFNGTSTVRSMLSATSPATYNSTTGVIGVDVTGNWTGTFDGQEGTFYLNRANHSGTQLASTISDFGSQVQALSVGTTTPGTIGQVAFWTGARTLGTVATGTIGTGPSLTVTSGRGVLGGAATIDVASGFTIPTSTGLSNLYAFENTPSTRITAGTGLSWSGNTLNATGGGGGGGLATGTPWIAGQVPFVTGSGTVASRATTTLVAGTGISFTGGTPIIFGSSPITIESTGGGGGGGALATTTDIIGDGGAQLASFVSSDFLIGGGSSTTAEFQFDDDGGKFILSSSSNAATATIASVNTAQAVQIGVASTTGASLVRGIVTTFSSTTAAIVRSVGSVVDYVFDMPVRLLGALKDVTGSPGVSGMVLQSTGTSTIWVATSSLGIAGGGGGGSGTVNSGDAGQLAWYSATGTAVTGTSSARINLLGSVWTFIVDTVNTVVQNLRVSGNMSVGTTTYYGIEPIDKLYVDGFVNTGGWVLQECSAIGFTGTAQLTADTQRACDNFLFNEDAAGVADFDLVNANYPPNIRLRAGATGATNAAGDGAGLNTTGAMLSDHFWKATPKVEAAFNLRVVQNATGTVLTFGLADRASAAGDHSSEPGIGFYFFSSSTPNWLATCNPVSGATTYIDTGVPTSTVSTGDELAFRHYRIDTGGTAANSASAVFRIRTDAGGWLGTNGIVASCSGINMDSVSTQIGPVVSIGRVSAAPAQPEMGVTFMRYGYRAFLD